MNARLISCEVASVSDPCPNLRRITLHSPEFIGYQPSGPDEYFGLLMPRNGRRFETFTCTELNIRACIAALAEHVRPDLRWYTIRKVDAARGLVSFDVVLHSHAIGPGIAWISRARVGDTCGFWTANSLWQPTTNPQVLVADATGSPALLSILEGLSESALSRCSVAICAPSPSEVETTALSRFAPALRHFSLCHAPTADAPSRVTAIMNDWQLNDAHSLWASGEDRLVKAARKFGIQQLGLSPKSITFVPFWYEGKPRP